MYAAGAAGTYNPDTDSNQDAFDKGIINATELAKINGLYNLISAAEGEMVQKFLDSLPYMDNLDDAEAVIVESGAAVDAAQAAAIQGISGYAGTMSDMDITDTAAALISAGDHVLNVNGVDHITTTEATVGANDGAILASFTADVHFDVDDSANLAAVMAGLIQHLILLKLRPSRLMMVLVVQQ